MVDDVAGWVTICALMLLVGVRIGVKIGIQTAVNRLADWAAPQSDPMKVSIPKLQQVIRGEPTDG